jgi:hypothetical protein
VPFLQCRQRVCIDDCILGVNGALGTRARENTVVIISTLLFLVVATKIDHLTFVASCEYATALCYQVKSISIIWSAAKWSNRMHYPDFFYFIKSVWPDAYMHYVFLLYDYL